MKCVNCENQKELKKETRAKVKYKEGGLPNVTLAGVDVYRCDECGEEYFDYGNLDVLHQQIGEMLLSKKGLLNGKEVRFLRSQLGYSGRMFAKLIGYEPETLCRIENGTSPVIKGFDRLVRFAWATFKLPNRDYDLHDTLLDESKQTPARSIELRRTKAGWRAEAVA